MKNDKSLIAVSKRLFFQGLAALLPTLITIVILVKLFSFVNDNFGRHIGRGLTYSAAWAFPHLIVSADEGLNAEQSSQRVEALANSWQMSLVGFLVAIVLVCVLGFLLASFIGRRLWRSLETTLVQLPVIKQIYPYVKQVTDYVFGERRVEFSQVVAVQYPRVGIWSIGFVTGPGMRAIRESEGEEFVSVFVPSSPTPVTGYVITVPRKDTVDLPITIDQAFRFIISGGVITPDVKLPTREESSRDSDIQESQPVMADRAERA